MMYGYGSGAWWMMFMPLAWIALVALAVWVVVRLVRSDASTTPERQASAREILDRRYAAGEIDTNTYSTMRTHLAGPGAS